MRCHNQIITQWYQRTPGRFLLQVEKNLLYRTLSGTSGRCCLHWSNFDLYELELKMNFDQHLYLSTQQDFPLFTRGIQVDVQALPFLSESVDIVFFPHFLEFSEDPFALLKEAYRILKPGGYLLILNFNPVSFWGLGRLFWSNPFPWNGHAISALYLRCFLMRLGLNVVEYKTDFFRPLFSSPEKLGKYAPLETVGQICWPFLGAVYLMMAQKEKEDLVLIKSEFDFNAAKLPRRKVPILPMKNCDNDFNSK